MSVQKVTGNDLSNPWGGWLVGIVLTAFGVGMLEYDLRQIAGAIDAASWVEAKATLDLVEVGSGGETGTHVTALSYHYNYKGKRYDSHRGALYSAFDSRFIAGVICFAAKGNAARRSRATSTPIGHATPYSIARWCLVAAR